MTTVDPEGLDVQIAAEVKHFDPRDFMDVKAARRMDRFAQLAVAAAGQALRDAGLEIASEESERIGVMLNTGGGGIQTLAREALHYHEGGPARVSPFTIPMTTPAGAARGSTVRSSAVRSRPTPSTSASRRPTAPVRRGPCAWRWRTPTLRRGRSTTSAPMAPRPPTTTLQRRPPSRPPLAMRPTTSPSVRPRA